jgi:hypothetical protein
VELATRAETFDYQLAFAAAAASADVAWVQSPTLTRAERLARIESFADERGHRRLVDKPLLAWLTGLSLEDVCCPPARPQDLDVAAWIALVNREPPSPALLQSDGPFVPLVDAAAIEVATELELATLHAMSRHATLASHPAPLREAIHARTLRAASWLLDNLQPDNATNHPWAAHVFATIAKDPSHPRKLEAGLYAQALLHNSLVPMGRPDRFSAIILLDASAALREQASLAKPANGAHP